jgi:transglutaminase-like putative cysteine protease
MRLHIRHTTRYRYTEPLRYALQTLWLTPRSGPSQTVAFWSLGAPGVLYAQHDGCGNTLHSYTFVAEAGECMTTSLVNAAGQVDTLGVAQFSDDSAMPHPAFFLRSTELAAPHSQLAEFGRRFVAGPADLPALLALSRAVADTVRYQKNSTSVETTALQAFKAGAGVCQDQAHVMVAICRSLGLPARFVSRYF